MQSFKRNGKKMIGGLLFLPLIFGGLTVASYGVAVPEPAKLLLFGATLVGGALWCRKHLKRQES